MVAEGAAAPVAAAVAVGAADALFAGAIVLVGVGTAVRAGWGADALGEALGSACSGEVTLLSTEGWVSTGGASAGGAAGWLHAPSALA